MKDYAVYFRLLRDLPVLFNIDLQENTPIRIEKYTELLENGDLIKDPLENQTRTYSAPISTGLLRYLINNHQFFLNRVYKNVNTSKFGLVPIKQNGSYDTMLTYAKSSFVRKIELAYAQGQISQAEYDKTQKLRDAVKFEKMLEEYDGQTVSFKNRRGEYTIPVSTFIELLNLEGSDIDNLLKEEYIAGVPKEEFISCMTNFFRASAALKRYLIPTSILLNKTYIESKVDTQAANVSLKAPPEYTSQIQVNEELWNRIWSKVPSDFTNLEKAYYIYYQLCKTFTYDEEWLATRGLGNNCQRHLDINYIKNLSEEERDVVCYEFNAIFSKFLESLGATYEYIGISSEQYSTKHTSLRFIIDKFLVGVDAVSGILSGDLPKAKMHQILNDFKLQNYSSLTKEEFARSIIKVNRYIREEEKQDAEFMTAINQYRENKIQGINLSSEERRDILLELTNNCSLPAIDSLTYIQTLRKSLFPRTTSCECQEFFVIDNYPPAIRKKCAGVAVVICYSPAGDIKEDVDHNEYYIYTPMIGITQLNKQQLQTRFNSDYYDYIPNYEQKIPGITKPNIDSESVAFHGSKN